jgi:hypothetical protein
MLQISTEAKTMLADGLDEGQVYRLVIAEDQFALSVGSVVEGDTIYELDGVPVLSTPAEIAGQLDSTIDVEDTPEGARLVLLAA